MMLRWIILVVCFLAFLAMGVILGSVPLPANEILAILQGGGGDAQAAIIIWELRLPRVLLAALVGGGLAAAGSAYQALFRNPLADPFVIGAAAGAALGATVAFLVSPDGGLSVPLFAFFGTLAAVAVVYMIGGVGLNASPLTLLLAGAAVSTVLSSMVTLLILLDDRSLQRVYYWVLGGLSGRGWAELQTATPGILIGLIAIGLLARPLDALTLGEQTAQGLGLPLKRTRAGIVVAASLVTAACVSVSGIIGFVGLVSPHLARMLFGTRHAVLIPASMLMGAALLIGADLVARTAIAPMEIPVGVLTAILGGPFFLYVLSRSGRGANW